MQPLSHMVSSLCTRPMVCCHPVSFSHSFVLVHGTNGLFPFNLFLTCLCPCALDRSVLCCHSASFIHVFVLVFQTDGLLPFSIFLTWLRPCVSDRRSVDIQPLLFMASTFCLKIDCPPVSCCIASGGSSISTMYSGFCEKSKQKVHQCHAVTQETSLCSCLP